MQVNQQYYSDDTRKQLLLTHELPEVIWLGPYIFFEHQRTGSVKNEWLVGKVRSALQANDTEFFRSFISNHLAFAGIEMRRPQAALDALSIVFPDRTSDIEGYVSAFLSRLRIYYPDDVDEFLEEERASDDLKLAVRTGEPIETIGEMIGIRSFHFLRDDVIIRSDRLRSYMARIFSQASESKNTREWLDYIIREIINVVYGGEALRQSR